MVEGGQASSPVPEGLDVSLPLPSAAQSVRPVPGLRVLSLRYLADGAAVVNAVVAAHGLTQLPEPGTFRGADPYLVWTGPAEFLLLTTSSAVAAGVQEALAPGREALACALDQTAGCSVVELMGHEVADVPLHLLDVNALPRQVGDSTRTRLVDIGSVVLRLDTDRIWLVIDRAHREYVLQWIAHAMDAELGTT
jgi:heterotetrameric sarcosine oxidase gamma subunit